jgi:hypothetical protein
MNLNDAEKILDTLLQNQRLSDVQAIVFRQCWEGKTYAEIADEALYDASYVKDIGYRLWQLLSEGLVGRTHTFLNNQGQKVELRQGRS